MIDKKTDIWFPFFVKDYMSDTRSLDAESHGIYLLLIIECWLKGYVEDDDNFLLRLCGYSGETKYAKGKFLGKIREIIGKFLGNRIEEKDGEEFPVFYSKRVDEEREKANKRSNLAREKANKRWKKEDAVASKQHVPQRCKSQSQSQSYLSINPDRPINATINSPKTNSIHGKGTTVRTSSYGLVEEKIVEFDSETADMIISTFYGKDEISDSAKLKAYEQIQRYLTKRDSLNMEELLEATINYVEFWLDRGFDPEKPKVRRCTVFENYLKKDNLTYFLEGYEEGKGKSDSVKIAEAKSKNFKSVKEEMDAILQGAK